MERYHVAGFVVCIVDSLGGAATVHCGTYLLVERQATPERTWRVALRGAPPALAGALWRIL